MELEYDILNMQDDHLDMDVESMRVEAALENLLTERELHLSDQVRIRATLAHGLGGCVEKTRNEYSDPWNYTAIIADGNRVARFNVDHAGRVGLLRMITERAAPDRPRIIVVRMEVRPRTDKFLYEGFAWLYLSESPSFQLTFQMETLSEYGLVSQIIEASEKILKREFLDYFEEETVDAHPDP